MHNFKKFALLTALALSGAAFATPGAQTASDNTALSLTNSSSDTLEVGNVPVFTWDVANTGAAVLTNTGSLTWTTPASNESDRTIAVSLASALPTNVNSLTIGGEPVAAGSSGAVGNDVALTLAAQPLITAIAPYSHGATNLTYTFDVDNEGFTTDTAIVVDFTMTSVQ